jgi:hypothetical protein
MKNVSRILMLTLTMLPLFAAAQLKSRDKIVTQVPFEFMVGNKIVPSGQLIVQPVSPDSRTLMVRNVAAKMSVLTSNMPNEENRVAAHYALVFTKLGGHYFLSAITVEGSPIIYNLPRSKAEAELRAQNVPATEQTLLASLQ